MMILHMIVVLPGGDDDEDDNDANNDRIILKVIVDLKALWQHPYLYMGDSEQIQKQTGSKKAL